MNLYIVPYWLPFPSSEYGGVQIVLANSDEDCIRFISQDEEKGSYDCYQYPDYKTRISACVKQAKRIYLGEESGLESGIVDQFIT